MVPSNWLDGKVSDLLIGLESGVSVNGENRQLSSGEKGVLKVSAVSYGIFDPRAVKAIESPTELERAKTHPKKDQVIISRSNTEELVGASAYIDKDYTNLFLPDKLWQTISKPNASMKWLSYFLSSEHARYNLSNLATGTSGSMKNITKGELLSLKVETPPYSEQHKIAIILGTWDKAISTTERLIDNSKQQKKALMQQLLTGTKRLLDDTGKPFFGEWQSTTLKEVSKILKGKQLNRSTLSKYGHYPVINGGITPSGYTDKFNVVANTITISEGGNSCGYVNFQTSDFWCGGHCYHLVNLTICNRFLYQYLKHSEIKIMTLRAGSGLPNIQKKAIESVPILYPSENEQQKIASVLSNADKEIELLEQQLNDLKQEKKALMQQLLTGKRRVKIDDKEVA